jgi:hypothetical protein
MGRAYSTYEGEESCVQGVIRNPRKGDHFEDQGIDGKIALKWIIEK